MNEGDSARCQQAINLANAGQTAEAYRLFCALYNQDATNQGDVTLLYWLAYTTPYAAEAQRALATIVQMEPDHPKLHALRAYVQKKQNGSIAPPMVAMVPTLHCPYCHYTGPVRMREKVSTAGWIFFGVVLILFFPLCWIGLFIKKQYYACNSCGITLGEVTA